MSTKTSTDPTEVKQAAGMLVQHAAGQVAYRTIAMGLRQGLFAALADRDGPVAAKALSADLGLDELYTLVWLRSAHAAGVLELGPDGYELPPAVATALLDEDHGGHVGALFDIFDQPEVFELFEDHLASGERLWWDRCSPEFIAAVSRTSRPFYNRLVPGGLARVPGLLDVLEEGANVLELAVGSGRGLIRMANHYPNCRFVGVDGDAHSLSRAEAAIAAAGVADRVQLVQSTFEDYRQDESFDVAVINVSMHECRDIELVTRNVFASLRPEGIFVVSDFPFPTDDDTAGLRTPAGRVMSGIQFFEAQIDDQLLPTQVYLDLFAEVGFIEAGEFELSGVHAVSHARRPGA